MTVHPADVGASDRVYRGGGWYGDARNCRAASRVGFGPAYRCTDLGFRPARRFPSKSLTIHEMKP